MHPMFHLPHLAGVLLLAATPFAIAESPLPDPVAPAVIGRPLDQIRPVRPARTKPAPRKVSRPKQVAAASKAAPRPPSAPVVVAPAAVKETSAPQQVAKQVPARPPGPGYFSSRDRTLVRLYYEAHPMSVPVTKWKIGEPIPPDAALTGVPDDVRAALPALPRGYQYVQLDGEVVLVAVQSRRVVDGVRRSGG